MAKSQTKIAGKDWVTPKAGSPKGHGLRSYSVNAWRNTRGQKGTWQGITVFYPVDPYKQTERKEFRSAMENAYVYRANRIHTGFVAGQGYTTQIVPRQEEELPEEQIEAWKKSELIMVPKWKKEVTPDQIKDYIDKMAIDLDLQTNIYNGYFTALEQGRCVLAITPLDNDDNGMPQLPQQIRFIRPEFTLQPIVNDNTHELEGVYVVGAISEAYGASVPSSRMIYIMHGFNNELFSDYYGDSKVARISDIANALSVVLNEDYPKGAKSRWHTPRVFSVPIPPQEANNEQTVLDNVANKINEGNGLDVTVTGPSNPEETGITVISQGGSPADIGGLDVIRVGLVKSIVTAYGMPGFMLSEGDYGSLGGNANIEEVDMYLNTETGPDSRKLEDIIEKQFYDRILSILFQVEDAKDIPIKMIHRFNKPKLLTMLDPAMFSVFVQMLQLGLIDEDGVREILGLREADKETLTEGSDKTPSEKLALWDKAPVQVNVNTGWGTQQTQGNGWGQNPNGNGWGNSPTSDVKSQQSPWGARPKGNNPNSKAGWNGGRIKKMFKRGDGW